MWFLEPIGIRRVVLSRLRFVHFCVFERAASGSVCALPAIDCTTCRSFFSWWKPVSPRRLTDWNWQQKRPIKVTLKTAREWLKMFKLSSGEMFLEETEQQHDHWLLESKECDRSGEGQQNMTVDVFHQLINHALEGTIERIDHLTTAGRWIHKAWFSESKPTNFKGSGSYRYKVEPIWKLRKETWIKKGACYMHCEAGGHAEETFWIPAW